MQSIVALVGIPQPDQALGRLAEQARGVIEQLHAPNKEVLNKDNRDLRGHTTKTHPPRGQVCSSTRTTHTHLGGTGLGDEPEQVTVILARHFCL